MTGLLKTLVLASAAVASAEKTFRVQFEIENPTGTGNFTVLVHPEWSPLGAARFKELVETKFYDNTRFFRVIKNFMVQFGLSGDPAMNAKWRSNPINDEPVKKSNLPGYMTFAKTGAPNSRTTQLFINYENNSNLDSMGFAPFAEVEGNGLDKVVREIYECGERPNQGQIQSNGNAYLDKNFPELSKIVKARVIGAKGEKGKEEL